MYSVSFSRFLIKMGEKKSDKGMKKRRKTGYGKGVLDAEYSNYHVHVEMSCWDFTYFQMAFWDGGVSSALASPPLAATSFSPIPWSRRRQVLQSISPESPIVTCDSPNASNPSATPSRKRRKDQKALASPSGRAAIRSKQTSSAQVCNIATLIAHQPAGAPVAAAPLIASEASSTPAAAAAPVIDSQPAGAPVAAAPLIASEASSSPAAAAAPRIDSQPGGEPILETSPPPQLLDASGEVSAQDGAYVLDAKSFQQLNCCLPATARAASSWRLLFSATEHGFSLPTLFRRAAGGGACVIVIRDSCGCVFGAYVSTGLRAPSDCSGYYGTGESFLWDVSGGKVRSHRWSRQNSHFLHSSATALMMGSGDHCGLSIDSELLHGSSGACATFRNPCLCRHDRASFQCEMLEVWAVDNSATARAQGAKLAMMMRRPSLRELGSPVG